MMRKDKETQRKVGLELTFQTRASEKPNGISERRWAELTGEENLRVLVSETRVIVGSSKRSQFVHDLVSGERAHIDHELGRAYLGIGSNAPKTNFLKLVEHRRVTSRVIGKASVATELYRFRMDGLAIDCWSGRYSLLNRGFKKLWSLLLPFAREDDLPLGVPIEITVESEPGHLLAGLRLAGIRSWDEREIQGELASILTKPLSEIEKKLQRETHKRFDAVELQADVRKPGGQWHEPDFMWLVRHPTLAKARTALNTLVRPFWHFSTLPRTNSLKIDWWGDLLPYINCDKPNIPGAKTEGFLLWLKRLWLVKKVMAGEALTGFVGNEQAMYEQAWNLSILGSSLPSQIRDNIVACIEAGLPTEITRYLVICGASILNEVGRYVLATLGISPQGLFSDQRLRQFENAEFEELTKWTTLSMPDPIEDEFNLADIKTGIRLSDFEPEVTLNHPFLKQLSYSGDSLRAEFSIKQVYVGFTFMTWPSPTATNVTLAILTGGATTTMQTNVGAGYFNADDASIVLNLSLKEHSSSLDVTHSIGFRISVDGDRSEIDSSAAIFGVNLGQDLLGNILLAVASLADGFNKHLFTKINDFLASHFSDKPLRWTENWHPLHGPDGHPRRVDLSNGIWYGSLSNILDIPQVLSPPKLLNKELIPELGIAVTDEYLTHWIQKQIGDVPAERLVEVDWGALSVALPDPNSISLPDVPVQRVAPPSSVPSILPAPKCPPPAVPSPQRVYRTKLTRYRPVVDLGEDGPTGNAGIVRMQYEVSLDLVEVMYSAEPLMTTNLRASRSTDQQGASVLNDEVFTFQRAARRRGRYGPLQGGIKEQFSARSTSFSLAGGSEFPSPQHPHNDAPRPQPPSDFPRPEEIVPRLDFPDCFWTYVSTERILQKMIFMRVQTSARAYLGFSSSGELVLPRIAYSVETISGWPFVTANVRSISLNAELGEVDESEVGAIVAPICIADAEAVLAPATQPTHRTRSLVPEELALVMSLTEPIPDILRFRQQSGESDNFEYEVSSRVLHWPLSIEQRLTDCIDDE